MNEKELAQDKFMRDLIRNSGLEEAPSGFTISVMDRIESEGRVIEYSPIISKKAWFFIFSAVAACIAFILVLIPFSNGTGTSTDPYGIHTFIRNLTDGYINIVNGLSDSSFLLFIPAVISILLLLDQKFSVKFRPGNFN